MFAPGKHYNLLANLLSPDTPESKSFDEAVAALTTHFQPKSSVISERYSFHCRCQEPQETIADFVVSLKKLIIRCGYTVEFQPIVLRDRFVCGLLHESTRKRLLTESDDLTFDRAVEIATLVEKATTQAKHMKLPESRSTGIHNVKGKQPSSQSHKPTCHRCGGPHLAPSC